MAKKLVRTRITRQDGYMYYIKNGAIWAVPMKRKGKKTTGKKHMVVKFADPADLDYSKFLYYIDADGDVAASPRAKAKKKSKKK